MRFLFTPVLILGLVVFSQTGMAHGTEKHDDDNQAVEQSATEAPANPASSAEQTIVVPQPLEVEPIDEQQQAEVTSHEPQPAVAAPKTPAKPGPASRIGQALEDFSLHDFPTLHPMVVHVPVIMIPVAFLFSLISLFFANRNLLALAVAFAAAGVAGGYIAAFPMHPHTRGLSEAATTTLQQHDFFAYSTLGVTAFAVLLGAIALFKPGFLARGLFALVLLVASICVSVTAHYGGTLTYVHGVGVNGNFLDSH